MTDLHTYLNNEFRRYYPDATSIQTVTDAETETISVHVTTHLPYPLRHEKVTWVMEIGSDDDRFIFRALELSPRDELNLITVPLMPEEL